MATPSLSDLARTITQSAEVIDGFLTSSDLPRLSTDVGGSPNSPVDPGNAEIQKARFAAIEASKVISELLVGADYHMFNTMGSFFDTVALQAIYRFKILQAIPINGAVSYGDLARSSGMNEDVMRRLLRRAMSFGFLDETDGRVCHTKNSAYMIQRPNYIDMLGFFAEYDFRSSASIVDTIQMHPKPEEPTATPFNTAFQNDEIYHNYMGRDAARNSIFSGFMKAIGSDPGLKTEHIVRGYSWAELGEATIVDVGGSRGHTCVALAEAYPSLKFIVQDLPDVIQGAEGDVPEQVKHQIKFMGHNFFEPQPVTDAAVYVLVWILHDWPDPYCVKILRSLVKGMKKGSRILLGEVLLPPRGAVPWIVERRLTTIGLTMLAVHNSQERSLGQFIELVKEADPRLHYVKFQQPPGSNRAFVEILFDE